MNLFLTFPLGQGQEYDEVSESTMIELRQTALQVSGLGVQLSRFRCWTRRNPIVQVPTNPMAAFVLRKPCYEQRNASERSICHGMPEPNDDADYNKYDERCVSRSGH